VRREPLIESAARPLTRPYRAAHGGGVLRRHRGQYPPVKLPAL